MAETTDTLYLRLTVDNQRIVIAELLNEAPEDTGNLYVKVTSTETASAADIVERIYDNLESIVVNSSATTGTIDVSLLVHQDGTSTSIASDAAGKWYIRGSSTVPSVTTNDQFPEVGERVTVPSQLYVL